MRRVSAAVTAEDRGLAEQVVIDAEQRVAAARRSWTHLEVNRRVLAASAHRLRLGDRR